MVRIGLYSEDRKLLSALSSALGHEFQVSLEPNEDEVSQMLTSGSWDVVLLDLDSNLNNQNLLKQRIASCRRIVALQGSSVVMADDSLRGAAEELIRLGAYSYCRKPPSMRDLRAIVRRAHERAQLKRERQAAQQRLEEATSCDQMIGSSRRCGRSMISSTAWPV